MMTKDERLELALSITKGDMPAALNLLNLIDFSIKKGGKFPNVKMVLAEDEATDILIKDDIFDEYSG